MLEWPIVNTLRGKKRSSRVRQ